MANSQVVAQLNILDQDLLSPGLANLVQRFQASLIFPPATSVLYSGYQVASSNILLGVPFANFPFVYVRNVSPSGASAVLTVFITPQNTMVASSVNLSPGGIFLFANNLATQTAPFTSINAVSIGPASVGSNPVAEYLIAL
jgi:hypothetical protein